MTKLLEKIIFAQLVALMALIIISFIILFANRPKHSVEERIDRIEILKQFDSIILQNELFLSNQTKILLSKDIEWLQRLRLNRTGCYPLDRLTLFYHYCVEESEFPILFDDQCWPHSVDLYQKLLLTFQNISEFASEFVSFFNKLIKESEGMNNLIESELNEAFEYSRRIGRDCEHSKIWPLNFDPSLPSSSDDHELWELYCLRRIKFPSLISVNSGKYYLPGYYYERINSDHLKPEELWTIRWMEKKFIPYFNSNKILKERYRTELNRSKQYAMLNGLDCDL
ncbi:hypothetical protein SSS_01287 [Sarcoptes scabiei]|uniref:Uncharacterized protein n=1 Tax=Sarcoptes scabiei TaxID=52283 RepID=A0A834RG09_SARSC|nr:hypothetical protein SSS_01287 [Sarcoptes scabiei]UXI17677.1 pancreatic lipase-related protein 2-like [Sarcoptes scabiei]